MNSKITKPWGFEIKLTADDLPYTNKILFILAGQKLSLQYHDQKTETLTLLTGNVNITTGPGKEQLTTSKMSSNFGYTINPNTIHRLEAIQDSVIIEASTPEVGTTYRLEDEYNRPNETEEVRNQPNRGWSNS